MVEFTATKDSIEDYLDLLLHKSNNYELSDNQEQEMIDILKRYAKYFKMNRDR